ncbi:MAG: hypothetical protein O3B41_03570 [Bacteroidetes bacterium]|nr:hypothetical protein [Bacteroidota bacterium]
MNPIVSRLRKLRDYGVDVVADWDDEHERYFGSDHVDPYVWEMSIYHILMESFGQEKASKFRALDDPREMMAMLEAIILEMENREYY